MILDDIVAHTRLRVERAKQRTPLQALRQQASALPADKSFPFEQALAKPGISFICEIKRASPSKGIIVEDFPFLQIARDYQTAGADAISVLTEPHFFKGDDSYLQEVAKAVNLPALRKDFIIDEYQIYETRLLGASALLLICAVLDDAELTRFLLLAEELGLSALVEVHDVDELQRALAVGASVIGVNNRDLTSFQVDLETSARLRPLVPPEILFVSESGISTPADLQRLLPLDIDAVLIGEGLMLAADKYSALASLREVQS